MIISYDNDYNDPILIDDDRGLKLELSGWDDGSVNYKLYRKEDRWGNDSIDLGSIFEEDKELTKLIFETVYNYLLKKNGL